MTPNAIELAAPVLAAHSRSSTGVDFVHSFESGLPGPHVMVNAVTHGNEICGALVVDRLLRMGLRPTRGTLKLSFATIEAFSRFDPKRPYATRFIDEDFNRVWNPETLDGPRDSTELRRARALRLFVEAADYLVRLGARIATKLDGGTSTTRLVRCTVGGPLVRLDRSGTDYLRPTPDSPAFLSPA